MSQVTFNIIGDGSIGHLWTAYLSNNKSNCRLFGRSKKPLQQYQLKSAAGEFFYETKVDEVNKWINSDVVVICVKAIALEALVKKLSNLSTPPSTIVLMMNGMGLLEIVKQYLPGAKTYHATISHGALLKGKTLFHTGLGETHIGFIEIGKGLDTKSSGPTATRSHKPDQLIESATSLLNKALPKTKWQDYQFDKLLQKLLINCVINPLSLIYDVKNGQIISNPKIRAHCIELTNELAPLLEKTLPKWTSQTLFDEIQVVANRTARNSSSMREDFRHGRTTEIEFITGYLLEFARTHHIELPSHLRLYKQISQK